MMRLSFLAAILAVLAVGQVSASRLEPLPKMPALHTPAATDASIELLHKAAGDMADRAILEAEHENILVETDASRSLHRHHWDASVPELHLRTPTVDQLADEILDQASNDFSTDSDKGFIAALETQAKTHSQAHTGLPEPLNVLKSFPQLIQLGSQRYRRTSRRAPKRRAAKRAVVNRRRHAPKRSHIKAKASKKSGFEVMSLAEVKEMLQLEGMNEKSIKQTLKQIVGSTSESAPKHHRSHRKHARKHKHVSHRHHAHKRHHKRHHKSHRHGSYLSSQEIAQIELQAKKEVEREFKRKHARAQKHHSSLRRLAGLKAYSAPVSLVETRTRARAQEPNPAFNPSAVQLGPSMDAFGAAPMTDTQFLMTTNRVSMPQMNVMYQPATAATWAPPPIEAEMAPKFVVGLGGLRPNIEAGPYQGQYGIAAGGTVLAQPPLMI